MFLLLKLAQYVYIYHAHKYNIFLTMSNKSFNIYRITQEFVFYRLGNNMLNQPLKKNVTFFYIPHYCHLLEGQWFAQSTFCVFIP